MIDFDGNPKVLEYNCRFGDPETQPILMRLRSDLSLCAAAINQTLDSQTVNWDPRVALGVVMVAEGYPGDYQRETRSVASIIRLLKDAKVFHAGTRLDESRVLTDGGRVLCVTALGDSIADAQHKLPMTPWSHIFLAGADWRGYRLARHCARRVRMSPSLNQAVVVCGPAGLSPIRRKFCFGLGCDPWNESAVRRILKIEKNRHWRQGLIVIADKVDRLRQPGRDVGRNAYGGPARVMARSSLLVTAGQKSVPTWVRGEHATVAVRVTALCAGAPTPAGKAAWPDLSTSANRSGRPALRSSCC